MFRCPLYHRLEMRRSTAILARWTFQFGANTAMLTPIYAKARRNLLGPAPRPIAIQNPFLNTIDVGC